MEIKELHEIYSENIKRFRTQKGLKQDVLAEKVDLSEKYISDLENLTGAHHEVFETTFDLKKNIFNDSDVIICLAGGTGTVSEFFSHLEEIRSNDIDKLLVVYDEDHHFDTTLKVIEDLIDRKFNDDSIYNFFKVAHNVDEFKNILKENGKI